MLLIDYSGSRAINLDHVIELEVRRDSGLKYSEENYYLRAEMTSGNDAVIYRGTKEDCLCELRRVVLFDQERRGK